MQIRRSFALSFGLAVLLTGSTAIAQSNSSAAARQWFLSSHLFQTSSGITINYAEQGDPQGPVLVFLHGGGDSWHSWDRVFPLIPARYHVYALTLRGHGLSDHPEHGYATDDFAADVLDFLKQKEIHQATLIGHSLGSFVAQRQVETDPDRIARLVLIGSGTTLNETANDHNQPFAFFATLQDPIPASFARDFQASTIHAQVPAANFELWVAEAQRVTAVTLRGIAHDFHSNSSELGKIKIPVLIFWGDHDEIFSRADEDKLVAALPNAHLKVFADTGHALHWERPELFTHELLHFVGGTPQHRSR
jgi:pimeloyl-ACP methyl ester carboxylesterase